MATSIVMSQAEIDGILMEYIEAWEMIKRAVGRNLVFLSSSDYIDCLVANKYPAPSLSSTQLAFCFGIIQHLNCIRNALQAHKAFVDIQRSIGVVCAYITEFMLQGAITSAQFRDLHIIVHDIIVHRISGDTYL